METNSSDYIITGGKEGKDRLNILSDVLFNDTRSLLEVNGLTTGQSFLDLGCGGGNVAILAAQIVGDGGNVTGIDFDESIIELARQDAVSKGVNNVSFRTVSAYEISYNNEFNIVYARFLLSHLARPAEVLEKMLAAVKPGGKVIVEDIHFIGHFCYPACEAFNRYVALYAASAQHNHQNADIGPSMVSLFRQAGIENIAFDVIQPCFSTGPGKWMAYITMDKIKKAAKDYKLASEQEVAGILQSLKDFTEDENTIVSLPRIFRVWGTKN